MRAFAALICGVWVAASSAFAQSPAPKVTPLLQESISGLPDKIFVTLSMEWPVGAALPRHTHPGDEYGSVIAGAFMVKIGSEDWKTYHAGQSWHVPAGVVHESKNDVDGTKTINSLIVEKGKPLSQPAP